MTDHVLELIQNELNQLPKRDGSPVTCITPAQIGRILRVIREIRDDA
jgi:hypothetical protein